MTGVRRTPPEPVPVEQDFVALGRHQCYCGRSALPYVHTLREHWSAYPWEDPLALAVPVQHG